MPVEFVNKKPAGPKRLRFIRNTAYQGTNYGPDYPQDECLVEARFAYQFIGQARAVDLDALEAAQAAEASAGKPQQRDPQAVNRDPEIAPAAAAPDLSKMTKAQLLGLAQERGVGVTEALTKAQIIEALEA